MKLKSAPLDLILQANHIPTGDELRAQQRAALDARLAAERAAAPRLLNARQRRNLRRLLAKHAESTNDESPTA